MEDGTANRRMNAARYTAQTNRRLPGLHTKTSNDETAIFQSVAIPHFEDAGCLNCHESEFLRYSAEGNLTELRRIFEEKSYYLFHLDVNSVDSLDRTALSLALLNGHIEVVRFLLSDEIDGLELGDALFYAIECEFYEAVEVILEKDSQTAAQIVPGTTSPFAPGLTPFMLAATKNNYKLLLMLYKYNHRLSFAFEQTNTKIRDDAFDTYSWDAVMERLLHFRARASPAFMLLMYNEKGMVWDPLNTAMELFGELRLLAKKEREVDEAYLQMAEQCENFALQLLQEVRSAVELADLMRYDLDADPDADDDPGETDRIIIRKREKMKNYLKPIEKAIKYKMKDFVTSDNSQLALIYIQKGSLFRKIKGKKALLLQTFLGFIFPVLSIAFLIAPDSKLGRMMRNPTVKFVCSIITELIFVAMLLVNTVLTQYSKASERDEIPPLLIVAYVWIVGKLVQEVREIHHQGLREYVSDVWNWNDIGTIFFFTCYMLLRMLNHWVKDSHGGEFDWNPQVLHPIPLSDICIAFAYILIHLRILELLRADRRFGPLQVSLDLMTRDAMRFFLIFFIIFLAFGSGITELYAPFGTEKDCCCKCNNCTAAPTTAPDSVTSGAGVIFTTTSKPEKCELPCKNPGDDNTYELSKSLFHTLEGMFWTMFGYGEPQQWIKVNEKCEKHQITEIVGTLIICVYHIVAIIVLVNMLIAMMSNSFQKTHDDAEREWKFHRTQLWLKFIRNEISQPPPMNLIPRVKNITKFARYLKRKFILTCKKTDDISTADEDRLQYQMRMQRRRTGLDTGGTLAGVLYEGETRYSKVLKLVVIRYLKKKVLNNEMPV